MYWCEHCQRAEEPVQKREEQYHDEVDTRNYEVTYIDVCPDCGRELYLTADKCPICGRYKDARFNFCFDCLEKANIVITDTFEEFIRYLPSHLKEQKTNDLIDLLVEALEYRRDDE